MPGESPDEEDEGGVNGESEAVVEPRAALMRMPPRGEVGVYAGLGGMSSEYGRWAWYDWDMMSGASVAMVDESRAVGGDRRKMSMTFGVLKRSVERADGVGESRASIYRRRA